jgi:signal transduction histidine kinase/CheY-like chemotaxis protein
MGKTPGQGIAQNELHDFTAETSPGDGSGGTGGPIPAPVRLLLIEDSQDDVALTRRAFKSAAPHVVIESVARGRQAIERIEQDSFDAAVLDMKLPDMDGISVLAKIGGRLPVVVTTGRGDERLAVSALKAGAVDYLVKDASYLDRLPQTVASAVRAARLDAENRRLARETDRQATLLGAILQANPAGICVFRGPDLRVELVNESYRRLVPHWGGDLQGKRLADLNPLPEHAPMPEVVRRVYDTGESLQVRDLKTEHAGQASYFDVHMMQLNGDAAGEDRGVLVVAWDTTSEVVARERAEEVARQSEAERAWLQKVIDYMPEGVVIAGADGSLQQISRTAREMFDSIPSSIFEGAIQQRYNLTAPDGAPVPDDRLPIVRAIRDQETVIGEELTATRADGTTVDLLCNASPLFDGEGNLVAGVLVFQDISPLKDVERLKDEFMSVASHELRTPLASVKATAQFLLRKAKEGDAYARQDLDRLSAIVQQSSRMARLIEELLDVGRLQSGRIQIDHEPFDLSELVRESVESARYTYPQCTMEMRSDGPIEVVADRDRIGQVLTNLLDNAVKYSMGECRVEISLTGDPEAGTSGAPLRGTATIEVRDHGVGFDPDEAHRLFERFSRLGPLAHHSRGMGLGLFISKQIVDAHGGTINAHSEGPNRGATMTVVLPMRDE